MDLITFAIVVVLSVSVWAHKGKIEKQDKRIDAIEKTDSLKTK